MSKKWDCEKCYYYDKEYETCRNNMHCRMGEQYITKHQLDYIVELLMETLKEEGLEVIKYSDTKTHHTTEYESMFVKVNNGKVLNVGIGTSRTRWNEVKDKEEGSVPQYPDSPYRTYKGVDR